MEPTHWQLFGYMATLGGIALVVVLAVVGWISGSKASKESYSFLQGQIVELKSSIGGIEKQLASTNSGLLEALKHLTATISANQATLLQKLVGAPSKEDQ